MRVDGYTPRQELHSAFAETRERPKSRHPVSFEELSTSTNAKECHPMPLSFGRMIGRLFNANLHFVLFLFALGSSCGELVTQFQ